MRSPIEFFEKYKPLREEEAAYELRNLVFSVSEENPEKEKQVYELLRAAVGYFHAHSSFRAFFFPLSICPVIEFIIFPYFMTPKSLFYLSAVLLTVYYGVEFLRASKYLREVCGRRALVNDWFADYPVYANNKSPVENTIDEIIARAIDPNINHEKPEHLFGLVQEILEDIASETMEEIRSRLDQILYDVIDAENRREMLSLSFDFMTRPVNVVFGSEKSSRTIDFRDVENIFHSKRTFSEALFPHDLTISKYAVTAQNPIKIYKDQSMEREIGRFLEVYKEEIVSHLMEVLEQIEIWYKPFLLDEEPGFDGFGL